MGDQGACVWVCKYRRSTNWDGGGGNRGCASATKQGEGALNSCILKARVLLQGCRGREEGSAVLITPGSLLLRGCNFLLPLF